MQQRTASIAPRQSQPVQVAALEVPSGSEGAWLVCGHHTPTGRRVIFTVAAADGDTALAAAKAEAASIDPFSGPDDWQFSVEFYDVDRVIAMQCDDTLQMDEPIPFAVISGRDEERGYEEPQDPFAEELASDSPPAWRR